MKKHLSLILIFIGSMHLNTAIAQNVTIDYQTWNPSSPPCNIFGTAINVPAIVNGTNSTIEHQSLIGQPQLNASPKEIRLACQYVSASSSLGTKYRIDYDFKVGYKYYITVNAAQLNSTTGYSTGVYLRLDMTNTGGGEEHVLEHKPYHQIIVEILPPFNLVTPALMIDRFLILRR